ncbi:MAG: serine/threonine-protein kinase [Polyangia bacterium]
MAGPAAREPNIVGASGASGAAGAAGGAEDPIGLIGQAIGSYRVLRLIGRGGMGAVYEARHSGSGHRTAVKFLYEKFSADRENVRRFINEAHTAIRVRHPGLVEIIESGELPSGAPYVMMEYLSGETLGARLRHLGRLPLLQALGIACDVAGALAYAHSRGVVHRDLKPDNIFLFTPPVLGSREQVKVLDFGIAKVIHPPEGEAITMVRTKTGAIMGTPTYMSPEQCRGAEKVVDRSDVYSLGLVLYEMLAGHPPFIGDSPGELLVKHILDEPPPLGRLVPDVPRDVAALVHHLLQKQAKARPDMHTVHGWLAALRNPRAPRPVLPFLAAARRERTRRLVLVLVLALCGVALFVGLALQLRPPPRRAAPELPAVSAEPAAAPAVAPAVAPAASPPPAATSPPPPVENRAPVGPRPPPRERAIPRKKPAPVPRDEDQVKPVY